MSNTSAFLAAIKDNPQETIAAMISIGEELRKGDRAIEKLDALEAAIDEVCPDLYFRLYLTQNRIMRARREALKQSATTP